MTEIDNPITRAVELAGGQSAVADALGISPQAVGHWCRKNRLPAERVHDLERLARRGARRAGVECITRHELRPDLYPIKRRAKA